MNSGIQLIKNKLSKYLKDNEVLDMVVFGSAVKGKLNPNDVDIAIISEKDINFSLDGFHFSLIKPVDFFKNPSSLINTLFREGFSLKKDKSFSEIYKFSSKVLFNYSLVSLSSSDKVKIVNVLRGKNKSRGLVLENNGEWLSNNLFIVPVGNEHLFERFFLNSKIKYRKNYILMH
jgi:predicted nucleotidyltransferase